MFVTTRVSDSDDLKMTESEVGRLAVAIEKEMFNLCLSTDSKYKNKYRSLMFNLKDPKNKVSSHKLACAYIFSQLNIFQLQSCACKCKHFCFFRLLRC